MLSDGNVITLGLQDSLIYDIPSFISEGPIGANGVLFNVTCQNLPNAAQAGSPDQANSTYAIHVSDDLEDINISPCKRLYDWLSHGKVYSPRYSPQRPAP